MPERKTHMIGDLQPVLCRDYEEWQIVFKTTNPAEVTCGHCLKRLGRS